MDIWVWYSIWMTFCFAMMLLNFLRERRNAKFWQEMSAEWEQQCRDWQKMNQEIGEIAKFGLSQATKWRTIVLNNSDIYPNIKPPTIN